MEINSHIVLFNLAFEPTLRNLRAIILFIANYISLPFTTNVIRFPRGDRDNPFNYLCSLLIVFAVSIVAQRRWFSLARLARHTACENKPDDVSVLLDLALRPSPTQHSIISYWTLSASRSVFKYH